ncbi:hypothetical protein [Corynebacterium amycolatum]|uniref:hypothetical protein n=1 Tax=Corynebacterium amycolatum TaxID=43765 RepID=UPI001244EC79|nr:hypothetical protein [Corynebacterium amycolatum]KAA9221853.1 hypothetical protein F6I44_08185 [Corynebacterium amycolatum]MDK6442951.1 hypothetical protein [Corynebacterium amycolatum]
MTRYWDHSGSIYKDDGQEDSFDPITEQQALAEIAEQQERYNKKMENKVKELRARMKSVGAQARQTTEQPYPTFTEQSAAYREGAQAYNEGKSWRDNPHAPESGLAAPWRMGFNTRKQQVAEVRAQRAAAAQQEN